MKLILEGNRIKTIEDFHKEIREVLEFPDYYGNNLDALWDCLTSWITLPLTLVWKDFEISKNSLGNYADKIVSVFKEAEKSIDIFSVEYC